MYKGYANSLKVDRDGQFSYPSVEPIRSLQDGLSVIANIFLLNIGTDAAEAGSEIYKIKATSHVAKRGDVILVTSGVHSGRETKVVLVETDLIHIADNLTLADTDTFTIFRHKYPTVNADGKVETTATLIPEPILFTLNGADQEVTEVTATPANSRPLPVKVLNALGNVPDFSTQTTSAAILAKIIAAPATEAKQDSSNTKLDTLIAKDFATQTTLAAVLAKIIAAPSTEAKQDTIITSLGGLNAKDFATQATLAAVLAKIIAAPSTEAKQDTIITALGTLNAKDFSTQATLAALNAKFSALGQNVSANSVPVVLPLDQVTDLAVTGQAAQTAIVNNILPAASGASPTDLIGYRSANVQVISTASGGTFIFEGSNDGTNFVAVPVFNQAIITGVPIVAAITATSSNLIYTLPVMFRYLRLRIVTTITGGSIQAVSKFSQQAFSPGIVQVAQSNAGNLLTTAAQSGAWTSRINDGSGNLLTSVLVGARRGLDTSEVGKSFADSARLAAGTVTSAAWTQVIASTAALAQGLYIFDSSGVSLELGFGAALSEARRLIIPPGGLNGFIPLNIPAATRISIRALGTTADYSAGAEFLATLLT